MRLKLPLLMASSLLWQAAAWGDEWVDYATAVTVTDGYLCSGELYGDGTGTDIKCDIGNPFITDSGHVGIGTNNPDRALHVSTTSSFQLKLTGAGASIIELEEQDAPSAKISSLGRDGNALSLRANGSSTDTSIVLHTSASDGSIRMKTASNDRLIITSNGRVGIGTTNPSSTLHVNAGGYANIQFGENNASGFHITKEISDDSFNIWSGTIGSSQNRLKIDSNGRVGVGTTNPLVALDVAGANAHIGTGISTQAATLELGRGRTGVGYAFLDLVGDTTYTDYGLRIIRDNTGENATSVIAHRGTGNLRLKTTEGAPILFETNSLERARISPDGYFGIGTNPVKPFHISGSSSDSVRITNTSDGNWNRIQFNKPSRMWSVGQDNSTGFIICDETAAVCRVMIDSSGSVGIGASPSYKLHVNGTAYATGAAGALSDRRHKKNIVTISESALDKIRQLRPVKFEWKAPKDEGMQGLQYGFIAQEVEKILPEIVLTQDDKDRTKGLKPTEFIPLLVKSVQILQSEQENQALQLKNSNTKIDSLEAEIAHLKAQIKLLISLKTDDRIPQ